MSRMSPMSPMSAVRWQRANGLFHAALEREVAARESFLREACGDDAELYGDVASLIADTVRKWDPQTITEKAEAEIGKDLQFIRINGTLIGGLVGLVLHTISIYL